MVFFLSWAFWKLLINLVEYTYLRFHLEICKYELARIVLVERDLGSKVRYYITYKFFKKRTEDFNV